MLPLVLIIREEKKSAKSKSWLWVKISQDPHPIVLMHYDASRAGTVAEKLFAHFSGYLQTDGYPGYNKAVSKEQITQLGCWAHARRKFTDVLASGVSSDAEKRFAKAAVDQIAELYKIEKAIKDEPPDVKRTIRQAQAGPIVQAIRDWLDAHFMAMQACGNAISTAATYLINQFEKLTIYLEDGRLAIDNNRAENHIRPIALGRKNWLFATSTQGATALANWYSIIETAKANGLDPFAYLKYLLAELPIYQKEGKDLEDLMPWNVELG